MPIIITSKKDGFRRCDVVHSTAPETYADDAFTAAQLAQLQADPMLLVEEKPAAAGKPARAKCK